VAPKDKALETELKQPDQFVGFWTKIGSTVAARRQAVLLGIAVLLGGLAVAWGASAYATRGAAEASRAFGRIQQIATAPLLPATGEAPKFDDDLPHFKTEAERLTAALKEADAFLGAHGGSKLKDEVQLLKARYLMSLGKPTEAAAIYEPLRGSLDERLRFLALEGLAYAAEASGQLDRALEHFSALADEATKAGNFYRDRALFNKARLLERKGNPKEAQKVYKEIVEKIPTTSLKEEINDRLALLEGK
jgi:tetratricopeptide (TPR) repeat protein